LRNSCHGHALQGDFPALHDLRAAHREAKGLSLALFACARVIELEENLKSQRPALLFVTIGPRR
jgi:hypothetical protein